MDALSATGTPLAVLHREAELASGMVRSDVDLVVAVSPIEVMKTAAEPLHAAGLHHIVSWPYDVGGTGTMMLATGRGHGGVQLDFLHDPFGDGQDGVKSDALLATRIDGQRWPTLDPVGEYLYLIRKRDRKGDLVTLEALLSAPPPAPRDELERTAEHIFRTDVAERVIDLLRGEPRRTPPPGFALVRRRGEARRWIDRLRRPVGFWANVSGPGNDDVARALAARFGAYLPHVGTGPRPRDIGSWQWPGSVGAVRWRAGLYVTWGPNSGLPRADLELESLLGIDAASAAVVREMEKKTLAASPPGASGAAPQPAG